jgi:octaprenyl-diphosphate synthase
MIPSLILQPMNALERRLHELVQSDVEFIQLIGEDLVNAGGKRARPQLVFLAARALGHSQNNPDARELDFAACIELLHSASLLHDDLVDDAETRRGHEAAFRHYGNAVSVLSGDYLLSRLMEILAGFGNDAASYVQLVARTARQICEGEVLQFQVAALETYSFENYQTIITGKTAALAAAACKGAAMLSGSSLETVAALELYGLEYGRAFQIQDDLLDLTSSAEKLGKPIGGDLREGKATLPVLYLFEAGVQEARDIIARRASRDGDVELMRDLANQSIQHGKNAIELCKLEILRRCEIAVAALSTLPASPAKKILEELAWKETERVS